MPRVNRVEIFADDEIQAFHLVNRCVRRTYLCGRDEETGRDYSHRKQWIRDRLEVLAGIFAIDVLSFAVMSNHLHVVARTRPDLVKTWSDDEVALRWWNLFPQRRRKDRSPEEPTEFEMNQIERCVRHEGEAKTSVECVVVYEMPCGADCSTGQQRRKGDRAFLGGPFQGTAASG